MTPYNPLQLPFEKGIPVRFIPNLLGSFPIGEDGYNLSLWNSLGAEHESGKGMGFHVQCDAALAS